MNMDKIEELTQQIKQMSKGIKKELKRVTLNPEIRAALDFKNSVVESTFEQSLVELNKSLNVIFEEVVQLKSNLLDVLKKNLTEAAQKAATPGTQTATAQAVAKELSKKPTPAPKATKTPKKPAEKTTKVPKKPAKPQGTRSEVKRSGKAVSTPQQLPGEEPSKPVKDNDAPARPTAVTRKPAVAAKKTK